MDTEVMDDEDDSQEGKDTYVYRLYRCPNKHYVINVARIKEERSKIKILTASFETPFK